MKRFLRLVFEMTTLFLILVTFAVTIGLGALLWRLEQGPLPLTRFVPDIETVLDGITPELEFRLGNVQLESGQRFRSLRLRLSAVRVVNSRGDDVGLLKDMILAYNWRNLAGLSFMPVAMDINGPTVTITRFENGSVGFNLKETAEQEPDAPAGESMTPVETVAAFLDRAPRVLRHIRINDATIRYYNHERFYSLHGENGLFVFHRSRGDITGTMAFDARSRLFHHRVTGNITYDEAASRTVVSIGVKDVQLDHLRLLTPEIPDALDLDMKLNLLVTASIDSAMRWHDADMTLTGKTGYLAYPPYLPQTLELSDFLLQGHYDPQANRLTLERLMSRIDGATSLTLAGQVAFDPQQIRIEAEAQASHVPVDKLPVYWPVGLGSNAREWIVDSLSGGIAQQAEVRADLVVPLGDAAQQEPQVEKLQGHIRFDDVTVDYLPPMPRVSGVSGEAVFDSENFDITARNGKLFDTVVTSGKIRIGKLLTEDPDITIALEIDGPVRDAIMTLSSDPLRYAQRMGMLPEQFDGTSRIALQLAFPLLNDLELEQIEMQANATLHDLAVRKILKDLSIEAETLALRVDTSSMVVTGQARVNASPATIEWHEYFSDDAPDTTVITASGKATPAILRGLRLPVASYFSGAAQSAITMRQDHEKTVHVTVDADLSGLGINVPELGIFKPARQSGSMRLNVTSTEQGIVTIDSADIDWPSMNVRNGMLRLDAAHNLESLTLKKLRYGRTRADIVVAPDGKGGTQAVISGDVVDASRAWSYRAPDAGKKRKTPQKNVAPLSVRLRAGTLYLDPEHPLREVRGEVLLRGDDLVTANLAARTGDAATLSIVQQQRKDGSRHLAIEADDTGQLLRALDMIDEVYGGVLTVSGQSTPQHPSQIAGRMTLKDFTLVKAPVLARLLNAFSPKGLIGLLNDKGLSFERMESDFILPDPYTITLDNGKMAGASLGLGFRGSIYRDTGTLDIRGTIVPLDGINKFFGKIPLLGHILGGINKDGLIGATYRVKGSSSDPSVSVNPLSALTPGIFRSILFE